MGLLDRTDFCSVLTAVDAAYINKFLTSYPTWVACHPEVINMPMVVVYDANQLSESDPRWDVVMRIRDAAMNYHCIPDKRQREIREKCPLLLTAWKMPTARSQRERMLTGLVRCVSAVPTPWYFKLDADTFANKKTGFYYDKWFRDNPAFIANPWGYTKPADSIPRMDAWAATIDELKSLPPLKYEVVNDETGKPWKCAHQRMASWTMFGNREWSDWAQALCVTDCLPFPSQDTYLSYIAIRQGKLWIATKFRGYGWEHCKNPNGLSEACTKTLQEIGFAVNTKA